MSKPINVEAQRVYKILGETVDKLKILSLLNCEFFDEIYKKEEEELMEIFGPEVGQLLYTHASLEQSFKQNNIGPDNKMIPLDDLLLPEEAKQVAISIRKTTSNIVRQFRSSTMQLKLKSLGESRSNEFAGFIEAFEQLKTLWWTKLATPLEEENSIKEQLRLLQQKTQKLKEIRDSKKEHLQKYEEETKEQKEQREHEIQNLKKTIADENASKEQKLKDLGDQAKSKYDRLLKDHKDKVNKLEKQITDLDSQLTQVRLKNKTDEDKLRADFKKADTYYQEQINTYDSDMKDNTREKEKASAEFQETHHDLEQISEDYKQRLEERKKREEILAIMKKKNDEQERQMDLLNRAADWVQSHWKGLLARREMEKARKGKKKKKKKK